ncbi:MAG: DUF362 domain-containing protein [Candidatus Geothermincolia bacterium]
MSEVLFTPFESTGEPDAVNLRVWSMLQAAGFPGGIGDGDPVAVKIHPGEKNNTTYLRPTLVRSVAEQLTRAGCRPFVTETTTLYCRERFTAEELLATAAWNGFSSETMGCPFVVADETPDVFVSSNGECLERVGVAAAIAQAGAMVVLSHVTGHGWTAGLAGSIKQLGMGCAGRETKARVHQSTTISIDEALCSACGTCAATCKTRAIDLDGGRAVLTERCVRCGVCIGGCPEGAIGYSHDYGGFARGLAEAAAGVLSCFGPGRTIFVNILADVTAHCDCEGFSEMPAFPDLGVLVSSDPVAIDQASADLINGSAPVPGGPADRPEVAQASDMVNALAGIEWWKQLEFAEALGMGTREYQLERV